MVISNFINLTFFLYKQFVLFLRHILPPIRFFIPSPNPCILKKKLSRLVKWPLQSSGYLFTSHQRFFSNGGKVGGLQIISIVVLKNTTGVQTSHIKIFDWRGRVKWASQPFSSGTQDPQFFPSPKSTYNCDPLQHFTND